MAVACLLLRIFLCRFVHEASYTCHVRRKVTRDKPVAKPAPGVRQCNCRNKVVTRQLGPGMFQQFQQQECQVGATPAKPTQAEPHPCHCCLCDASALALA